MFKKFTEVVVNFTVLVMCGAFLAVAYYYFQKHVTCVDFFQKLCVIH